MNYLKAKVGPEQEAQNTLFNHLLALFLLAVMIALALYTKGRGSPVVSMLCLGFFAQRMRPGVLAYWVVVFALTPFLFLLPPWQQSNWSADLYTAYLRLLTIVVGGIGAMLLSYDRSRIAEGFHQTLRILERLPTPVIVADGEGCVLFMNNDALKLLGTTADEARGASYFSFVTSDGKTIQSYFEFVDSKLAVLPGVVLHLKKPTPAEIEATLVAIEGKWAKLVAIVFSSTQSVNTNGAASEVATLVSGNA